MFTSFALPFVLAGCVSARVGKALLTSANVPVVVILFATTSALCSNVLGRYMVTLRACRLAMGGYLALQALSLGLIIGLDPTGADWVAVAGGGRAWTLCVGLAVLHGVIDALAANSLNPAISLQYEAALVPGGVATAVAMRGLGQFLMFGTASLIGATAQMGAICIAVAAATISLLVLLHSSDEARLRSDMTAAGLAHDLRLAPGAVGRAARQDARAVASAARGLWGQARARTAWLAGKRAAVTDSGSGAGVGQSASSNPTPRGEADFGYRTQVPDSDD